jgi:5-methylcytosine-specific restriction protein A
MAHGDLWTEEELIAAVDAYIEMLEYERAGRHYVKAEVRCRHQSVGPLSTRSKRSFEDRMRNISSVLRDLGHDWIPGYKPADHVGSGVAPVLARVLTVRGFEPNGQREEGAG